MVKSPAITVARPPTKPVLIYDGDCNFCKFWILRWQQFTGDRVEYFASQEPLIKKQFPEIPRERFENSVQFVDTDGKVYSGADGVFRSLACRPAGKIPLWLYRTIPGVAPVTEWAYAFVGRRREFFSLLTRLLWGRDGALPSHALVGSVFLRSLGIIYLCAFVSLGTQIIGLSGSNGIRPAHGMMELVRTRFNEAGVGLDRYHQFPTLCWFSDSDGFLHALCIAGSILALLLTLGLAPAPCLFLLWLIYLSLATVCREFLGFQWDSLLLETGFLAIFLAPLQLRLRKSTEPSRAILWLLRWLLFRLMFESGLVKLISGDVNWHNWTALNYHYETQPLPTWLGWYAHQLPPEFQKWCVAGMFVIELFVPFLIFGPRRLRFIGCWLLVLLQVVILLTGNYCFFNWLTIALCLLLLDDVAILKFIPAKWRPGTKKFPNETTVPHIAIEEKQSSQPKLEWPLWITAPLALFIIIITLPQVWEMSWGERASVPWTEPVEEWLSPFRSINTYGLFAVMTTSRPEIIVEGSNDGTTWREYEFKYKAGDLKHPPAFVAPHQPRLDWQMWFAALGDIRQNPWFGNFCVRLLQGSPHVLKLLAKNPFPDAPPRYIRANVYDYHFSHFKERRVDGVWWRRELKGEYLPAISLQDLK